MMVRFIPLSLLFVSAAAAVAADDPGGWTTAKWGMTADQVRAAVPDATSVPTEKFTAGEVSTLGIPTVEIARTPWSVFFIFDRDGRLSAVRLKSPTPSEEAFLEVDLALAEKYGRPMERKEDNSRTAQWSFPKTTIELRHVNLKQIRFESLWLSYIKPAPTRL